MISSFYSIADVILRLDSDGLIKANGMLRKFAVSRTSADVTVRVFNTGSLPEKGEKLVYGDGRRSFYDNNGTYQMFCSYFDSALNDYVPYSCLIGSGAEYELYIKYKNGEIWDTMLLDALDFPNILLDFGAVIMHCSFIIKDGKAILFTADKQVGKSTQAALWEKYSGAEIINGDRAAVKLKGGELYAYGVPYCGSSDISENKSARIAAVVELSQSKNNAIYKLDEAAAFRCVLGKFSYNLNDMDKAVKAADMAALISRSKVYHLSCLPDESAVRLLEEEL
ncbi:MAG: hypothetical protein PUB20_03245 [Clostridia bacterium]|nr:hypothetical protein [Clostridia bacterium]